MGSHLGFPPSKQQFFAIMSFIKWESIIRYTNEIARNAGTYRKLTFNVDFPIMENFCNQMHTTENRIYIHINIYRKQLWYKRNGTYAFRTTYHITSQNIEYNLHTKYTNCCRSKPFKWWHYIYVTPSKSFCHIKTPKTYFAMCQRSWCDSHTHTHIHTLWNNTHSQIAHVR